jgi:hypothetical protein
MKMDQRYIFGTATRGESRGEMSFQAREAPKR